MPDPRYDKLHSTKEDYPDRDRIALLTDHLLTIIRRLLKNNFTLIENEDPGLSSR